MAAVDEVLADVSPHLTPDIVVFNKVDRVADRLDLAVLTERLAGAAVEVVHASAHSGEGLDTLTDAVVRRLDDRSGVVDVFTVPGDGRSIAMVRGAGAILEEEVEEDGAMRLRVRLSPGALGVLTRQIGRRARIEPIQR